jgi:SAM-dependent methyltransferase
MTGLYIQYGSGFSAPEGWLNFDASPTLRFERLPIIGRLVTKNATRFPANTRFGNILRGLPVADGTADAIYASHVLEHLALEDCRAALRTTCRLLKPGGVFRLIVPDLHWRAAAYLAAAQAGAPDASARFMRSCYLGAETAPRGLLPSLKALLSHANHLWMWDEAAMRAALTQAGFVNIRRAAFGDNPHPAFAKVENIDRFVAHGHRELAMEAHKPA